MERLLPRHMQIIYLINALHLDGLRAARHGGCRHAARPLSLIDEHGGRRVRMGHLAFLGSHRVNGVSALHTDLMQADRVPRPARALSRTASSTRPTASPSAAGCSRPIRGLTELLVETHRQRGARRRRGAGRRCEPLADDAALQDRAAPPSAAPTRQALAKLIAERLTIKVDPDAMFDVQIKRIHEYKRQLLNILRDHRAVQRDPRASRRATGCRG